MEYERGMETRDFEPVEGTTMTFEEFRENSAPLRYFHENAQLIEDVREEAYLYYRRNNYDMDNCDDYRFVDDGRVTGGSRDEAFEIVHERDDMNFKKCVMWAIEDLNMNTLEKMALLCDIIKDRKPVVWFTGD